MIQPVLCATSGELSQVRNELRHDELKDSVLGLTVATWRGYREVAKMLQNTVNPTLPWQEIGTVYDR